MNRIVLSLVALALFQANVQAQKENKGFLNQFSIGAGVASLSINDDFASSGDDGVNMIQPSFTFGVEKRFGKFIGLSFDGLMGSAANNQRGLTPSENQNYSTSIQHFGVSVGLHFDNDVVFKKASSLSPFVTVGAAYTIFDPYGDLKAANGSKYYYWSDGSINDHSELALPPQEPNRLQRDYEYETQLSSIDYSRDTWAFPIALGLKWKLSNTTQFRATGTYVIALTDYLDNYAVGGNDSYLHVGASLFFTFRARDNSASDSYEGVDYTDLQKADSDGDGVNDFNDQCANTPKGMKVNWKGCIADDDNDGVPNNIDKEENTAIGARVDENGVTIPEEDGGPNEIKSTTESEEPDTDGGDQ